MWTRGLPFLVEVQRNRHSNRTCTAPVPVASMPLSTYRRLPRALAALGVVLALTLVLGAPSHVAGAAVSPPVTVKSVTVLSSFTALPMWPSPVRGWT
jgi:hypothetical protein